MASHNGNRPYTSSEIHLALLRPAILQILRAQGYYASSTATIDCLTELTGNYIYAIARRTAQHAIENNCLGPPGTPDIVDVRMALEDCGALWPIAEPKTIAPDGGGDGQKGEDHDMDVVEEDQDTRDVDEFIRWAMGRKNQRIRKLAGVVAPVGAAAAGAEAEDGTVEERPLDYLDALKRKHNKTDQDSKYAGTILGRGIEHGEVLVEGGTDTSLAAWAAKMREASLRPSEELEPPGADNDNDSRPPSSGLSSLADDEVEMMNF
ncbi:hypothetical protein F5Y16DRAFT_92032 [Xylariaceae sp. FL0255]|nr:hypothetical protein F5Y16DRAFT_92032 [Xylariaceae sp. FL0255]